MAKKVVREISIRRKRDSVQVIGYSQSDRGTRFVNRTIVVDTKEKLPAEVEKEIDAAIATLVAPQVDDVQFRMNVPNLGE